MTQAVDKCPILILCGGRGTRLRELGREVPKTLVELDGEPILAHKLKQGLRQGYNRFILATGYKGELVEAAVGDMNLPADIRFSNSGVDASMLRRIHEAREENGTRVIVTYGDSLANIDFDQLVDFHQKQDAQISIVSAPIQSPFGLVQADRDHRVRSLEEKPVLHYYIGTFVMEWSALDWASENLLAWPDGTGLVAFFKILMAVDRLYTYYHEGPDITFNTVEELEAAQQSYLKFHTHFK